MIPIDCIGLGKDFGSHTILEGISFTVEAGRVCAVAGSNGAGKTTMLKILATLVMPSTGQARICGEDIVLQPARVRKCIGYISSEERSFYWRLTGKQNLRFFAALQSMPASLSEKRIDHLLHRLGLDRMGDRRFREYSTGMRQALAIVRGLLHDAPVILADEPTRSLSPEAAEKFYDLVREESAKGKAILFATHNPAEMDRLADTVVLLDDSHILISAKPGKLQMRSGVSPEGSPRSDGSQLIAGRSR